MRKKLASLLLVLVLCMGLAVPAAAADQKLTVGEKTYEALLEAILSETEADSVTVRLDSDVTLTAAVVIGSSDYNGLFEEPQTVTAKSVTVDLNGYTLTAPKGGAAFEVQKDYTLTIVDNSEAKTGKLAAQGKEEVTVADGATYNALPTAEEVTTDEPAEETPARENPFTDVAETSPYYDAILWAVEKGITTGRTETTFVPGENCSRANIVTFLWRAVGSPEPMLTEQQYVDVADPDAYYYKAVQWAAEKDMWSFGTFEPNDPCDRLTAVYFMWRAAGSPEMEGELPFTDVPFGDGDENGQPLYRYADQAVLWAVEQGITNGTTATTFSPSAACTRGQIVTFLYRAENTPAGEAETTPAA